MRYIPHTEADVQRMLEAIGARSLDDLFSGIPDKHRLSRPLDLPALIGIGLIIAGVATINLFSRTASHG